MVNLISAENVHFILWPDQFQKIRQIKAWYYRIDLTNRLRSYNSLIPESRDECREFALNCLSFFEEMGQSEKDEYLKLWNKFDDKQPQSQLMSDNFDFYRQFVQNTVVGMEEVKKCMTIIGIYLTNESCGAVLIKICQFNHSCKSNAFAKMQVPLLGGILSTLIALKNIKAGQEITAARYEVFESFIYVLNRTKRQQELHRHSAWYETKSHMNILILIFQSI